MFSFRTTKLEDQLDKALVEGRVGCFCTQNCWDTSGDRYMWDIFRERGNLERLFRPEDAELTPGTNHIHFDSESLRDSVRSWSRFRMSASGISIIPRMSCA